jgi:hypothetical protein
LRLRVRSSWCSGSAPADMGITGMSSTERLSRRAFLGRRGYRRCIVVAVARVADHPWLAAKLDVSSSIAHGGSGSSEPRWLIVPYQFLLVSPVLAPIWIAGLVALVRRESMRRFRAFAVSWVTSCWSSRSRAASRTTSPACSLCCSRPARSTLTRGLARQGPTAGGTPRHRDRPERRCVGRARTSSPACDRRRASGRGEC